MASTLTRDHHNFSRTASFIVHSGTDAVSINWTAGNKYHLLLNNSSTVTFATNPINPCNLLLRVTQDNGGSKIITWAVTTGDVYWVDGTEPTLSTADPSVDILTFYFDGTDYFGVASLDFS